LLGKIRGIKGREYSEQLKKHLKALELPGGKSGEMFNLHLSITESLLLDALSRLKLEASKLAVAEKAFTEAYSCARKNR